MARYIATKSIFLASNGKEDLSFWEFYVGLNKIKPWRTKDNILVLEWRNMEIFLFHSTLDV